ncbi:hypothetical protein K438DRAFT_1828136 [Mycena galopus ATCC 62051]|nr:hypothetical protein K438DRAFT_1828136 [Mycena galopus ATCC 62051]
MVPSPPPHTARAPVTTLSHAAHLLTAADLLPRLCTTSLSILGRTASSLLGTSSPSAPPAPLPPLPPRPRPPPCTGGCRIQINTYAPSPQPTHSEVRCDARNTIQSASRRGCLGEGYAVCGSIEKYPRAKAKTYLESKTSESNDWRWRRALGHLCRRRGFESVERRRLDIGGASGVHMLAGSWIPRTSASASARQRTAETARERGGRSLCVSCRAGDPKLCAPDTI